MPIIFKDKSDYFHTSLYNYSDGEKAIVKNVEYDGYVAGASLENPSYYFRLESGIYFTPRCLDYHFYKIEVEQSKLIPMLKLDFGADNVTAEMLNEKFGVADGDPEIEKSAKNNMDILFRKDEYLMGSDYPLPLIRLLSENFVYANILINRKQNNYIYNRKTQQGYFLTNDSDFKMRFGLWLDDNVLYSFVEPYEAEKYINRDYMSKETIQMIENLKDDDNPIIIKYYFKQ